jgi:hypothetical protein
MTAMFTGHPDWLPTSANPAVNVLADDTLNLGAGSSVSIWTDPTVLAPVTVIRASDVIEIIVTTQQPTLNALVPMVYSAGCLDAQQGAFVIVDTALLASIDVTLFNPGAGTSSPYYTVATWLNVTMDQVRPDFVTGRALALPVPAHTSQDVAMFTSVGMFDRVAGIVTTDQDCDVWIEWADFSSVFYEHLGMLSAGDWLPFDVPVRAPIGSVWIDNATASDLNPVVSFRCYQQSGG